MEKEELELFESKVDIFLSNKNYMDLELINDISDKIELILSNNKIVEDLRSEKLKYFKKAWQILQFKKFVNSPSAHSESSMGALKKIQSFEYIPFL